MLKSRPTLILIAAIVLFAFAYAFFGGGFWLVAVFVPRG